MKKTIILLIAALMCFSLFACGEGTPATKEKQFVRETSEDGYLIISKEEFVSYITEVELTTENWKEYIDIVELTENERTAFGEITETKKSIECTAKNVIGCYFEDTAITFKSASTGKTLYCEGVFNYLWDSNYTLKWEDYTIDDLTCEKITGTLLIFNNVPEECTYAYEDGEKFICVGSKDNYNKITLNNTKDISMDISLAYWFAKK